MGILGLGGGGLIIILGVEISLGKFKNHKMGNDLKGHLIQSPHVPWLGTKPRL